MITIVTLAGEQIAKGQFGVVFEDIRSPSVPGFLVTSHYARIQHQKAFAIFQLRADTEPWISVISRCAFLQILSLNYLKQCFARPVERGRAELVISGCIGAHGNQIPYRNPLA